MTLVRLEKLAETDNLFLAKEAEKAGFLLDFVLCFASALEAKKSRDRVHAARNRNNLYTNTF